MLAALLLALAQGSGHDDGALALAARPVASSAHWVVAGGPFAVGQPFEAVLVVEHPPGAQVELDAKSLEADTSWLALDAPAPVRTPGVARADAETTRWSWRIASLEPGERDLPAPALSVDEGGARKPLAVESARATFESELAVGEDAPRPLKGFRPVESELARSPWAWAFAGGALLLLAALATWLWTRKRARRAAPAAPTASQRIEALAARDLDDPQVVRALHYELTALVREHFDALDRAPLRRALTDVEWLAVVAPLRPALAAPLGEVLRASEEIKYGPRVPTAWAVRELLDKARLAVQAAPPAAQEAA